MNVNATQKSLINLPDETSNVAINETIEEEGKELTTEIDVDTTDV